MSALHLSGEKLLNKTRRENDMEGEHDEFKTVYDGACKIGYIPGGLGMRNTKL